MKNNYLFLIFFIFTFLLSSSLSSQVSQTAERYHSLVIGECTLDIDKDSYVAVNSDGEMTVMSLRTNDIFIIHWKIKALDYIKGNFSKYNYSISEIENLKKAKSKNIDMKLIIGNHFYISTSRISESFQKNIIEKCNNTWTGNIGEIDLDMLKNDLNVGESQIEILTGSTSLVPSL